MYRGSRVPEIAYVFGAVVLVVVVTGVQVFRAISAYIPSDVFLGKINLQNTLFL